MLNYQIGDLCFSLDGEYEPKQEGLLECFRVERSTSEQIRYTMRFDATERFAAGIPVRSALTYDLYRTPQGYALLYPWQGCRYAFAVLPEQLCPGRQNFCYLHPELLDKPLLPDDRFFGMLAVHRIFLQRDAVIFHAAYIEYRNSAILFAAPSQTGKSTQAALWQRYAGARVINGDRVLLRKKGRIWRAYGYPNSGSSEFCQNCTLPLRCIVLLEQGEKNEVWIPTSGERVRALFSGMAVFRWDTEELNWAMHLAEALTCETQIVKLRCRPDAEAVSVLRDYLERW